MLEYIALILLFFVVLTLFYGIIAIHDIPYEISVKRNHPHQDAIHVAGWVSLFTMHAIWPFLWIWAMIYRDDRGWGLKAANNPEGIANEDKQQISELRGLINQQAMEIQQLTQAIQNLHTTKANEQSIEASASINQRTGD